MDPLEAQLRRTLADPRHALLVEPDPVPTILAGVGRRRRNRTVIFGATATATALVAVGALLLGTGGNGPTTSVRVIGSPTPHAPTPTQAAPAPSQGSGSNQPLSSTSGGAPTVDPVAPGPVPAGFTGADLTFVSVNRGWALGTAPCAAEPCTSLLRTSDGGRSWSGGPAPRAGLTKGNSSCSSTPCVSSVRFADPLHGYAFGEGTLFTTADGGAHWTNEGGPATTSLEPSGRDVLRVVTASAGCPGCTFQVQQAAVGSSVWTTLPAPELSGVRTLLLRHANDVYVFAMKNPAGGAGSAHPEIIVSRDRGRTWARRSDPCSPAAPNSPSESDASDAALAPDGALVVLCQTRTSGGGGAVTTSRDGGATFGQLRSLPAGSFALRVAASNSNVIVATVGALLASGDRGVSWHQVAAAPTTSGTQDAFLAFTDPLVGSWLPAGSDRLWRTTDGGATWAATAFRRP